MNPKLRYSARILQFLRPSYYDPQYANLQYFGKLFGLKGFIYQFIFVDLIQKFPIWKKYMLLYTTFLWHCVSHHLIMHEGFFRKGENAFLKLHGFLKSVSVKKKTIWTPFLGGSAILQIVFKLYHWLFNFNETKPSSNNVYL